MEHKQLSITRVPLFWPNLFLKLYMSNNVLSSRSPPHLLLTLQLVSESK